MQNITVTIGNPLNMVQPNDSSTPKKYGSPRRTVDLQQPHSQCLTETHHFPSSFHLASQIPANTFKRVLDAVDGYHAIPLDKESRSLTAFITEWDRYVYD